MNWIYVTLLLVISSTFTQAQPVPDDAWRPDVHLAGNDAASRRLEAHINHQLRFALRNIPEAAPQKAAGIAERLIAQADYDFTMNSPGDSVIISYSNSRGSSFNYESLEFEFTNPFDFPSNGPGIGPGVQFDTVLTVKPTSEVFISARTYNTSGKPFTSLNRQDSGNAWFASFAYNLPGMLSKSIVMDQQAGTGLLDSTSRDFYFYDSNGFLIRDSSESWNGNAWTPSFLIVYTPNAAGFPTLVQTYTTGMSIPTSEMTITYTLANKRVLVITRAAGAGGSLINTYKDSFAYVGSMLSVYDRYRWDNTLQSWSLYRTSRSRLDAAGLRDSIVISNYPSAGSPTVVVRKLKYDSYGNPLVQDLYDGNGLYSRQRFYYETYNTLGVQVTEQATRDIYIYPNPATSSLNVHGFRPGRYSIVNSLGQIVQSGSFDGRAILLSPALPCAQYFLQLKADNGASRTVSFCKE